MGVVSTGSRWIEEPINQPNKYYTPRDKQVNSFRPKRYRKCFISLQLREPSQASISLSSLFYRIGKTLINALKCESLACSAHALLSYKTMIT